MRLEEDIVYWFNCSTNASHQNNLNDFIKKNGKHGHHLAPWVYWKLIMSCALLDRNQSLDDWRLNILDRTQSIHISPSEHGGFPINHGGFPINHGGIFSDFRGSSQSFPHPVTKKSEKHSQSNQQKCFIYVQLGIVGTLKNECKKNNIVSSRRSLKNQSVKTRRILASPMILAVDMASTLSGCTWRYAVNKLVYEHIWLQVYPASAPVCL